MKTNVNIPQENYAEILRTINQLLSPCTVYVFGIRQQDKITAGVIAPIAEAKTQNYHVDLVVFSSAANANTASDIANTIRERTQGKIAVSLLLHKPADLATKQTCQQWFFWSILRDGQRLCLDKQAVPYLPDSAIPQRDTIMLREFWLKCEAVAAFYINTSASSVHIDLELVKIAQLHQAAEQIALGLIRIFLGYTPNHFSLSFLLDLCGHFTALPAVIFQQSIPEQCCKRLCAPPAMLRHWHRLEAPETDFLILLNACQEFLKGASALVTTELERHEKT
jgi:hypothetical protein